jgi:hypothetical protein
MGAARIFGNAPRTEVNSLWRRPMGASPRMMQLLLDESADDFWVFRRQRDIRPASLQG